MKKSKEKSPFSESLAAYENGLGIESFQSKLERNGARKTRALDMSKYIMNLFPCNRVDRNGRRAIFSEEQKLAYKISNCADFLVYKNYYEKDEVRLHGAKLCKKHLLCPFCAARRATKYVQAYLEKLEIVINSNPNLKAYFVTITIKDRESLIDAYNHLRSAMRKMIKQRLNANRGQKFVEFAKALGGVYSIEFKRGKGSGLWHPHAHMIWLCEIVPNAAKLSQEWLSLTDDSYIVDVRECYGETITEAFMEVFKYALKFSDMTLEDNWHAYDVLKGRRLVDSFGCLKGVKIPENLLDEEITEEPYILMLYKFLANSGYNFVGQGDEQQIVELLQQEVKKVNF